MKRIGIFFATLALCNAGHAAFNGLSIHSRANCVNNESISWDWTHYWILNTQTSHYYHGKLQHVFNTGWQNTWRSAAVHWGEGRGGWTVKGEHYIAYRPGDLIPLGTTHVSDCSIYNGWWERSK